MQRQLSPAARHAYIYPTTVTVRILRFLAFLEFLKRRHQDTEATAKTLESGMLRFLMLAVWRLLTINTHSS